MPRQFAVPWPQPSLERPKSGWPWVRSRDVIHSFSLPNFRVKQDAVPGCTVTIWFTPDRAGAYQIACAQLCGVGHYTLRGNMVVEADQAAFDAWLAKQGRR